MNVIEGGALISPLQVVDKGWAEAGRASDPYTSSRNFRVASPPPPPNLKQSAAVPLSPAFSVSLMLAALQRLWEPPFPHIKSLSAKNI